MRQTLGMQTWSGALTIGSFIVISLTGILMFFHINIGLVKLAHEWLSWVFVVAAICHAIVHWKLLLGYFRNRAALAVMVPILVLGGLSLIPAGGNGPTHPLVQVMARLERAPPGIRRTTRRKRSFRCNSDLEGIGNRSGDRWPDNRGNRRQERQAAYRCFAHYLFG